MWAGRLAWLGHLLDVQKVAGPNPVRPTTNLDSIHLIELRNINSFSLQTQL